MAKGDFWFKFEWDAWRNDPALRKCSLATQGFWLNCICVMHQSGSDEIAGTESEIARLIGCFPDEVGAAVEELQKTQTCDVTLCNDDVTLKSRRRNREVKALEDGKLRVQRHREKQDCNASVTRQSKSKSIEIEKEKKKKSVSGETPTLENIIAELSVNPAYAGIDVTREAQKAKVWIDGKKNRRFTRQFLVNWLNNIEPEINGTEPSSSALPANINIKPAFDMPVIAQGAPF